MFVLDTNVLSELIRPQPNALVTQWVSSKPLNQLYTTAITVAEMRHGINAMPNGKRKDLIRNCIDGLLLEDFSNRILPFDEAAAVEYADWVSTRQNEGRPVSQFDAQIAAIAVNAKATLVTRNVKDFDGLNTGLIDPWNH